MTTVVGDYLHVDAVLNQALQRLRHDRQGGWKRQGRARRHHHAQPPLPVGVARLQVPELLLLPYVVVHLLPLSWRVVGHLLELAILEREDGHLADARLLLHHSHQLPHPVQGWGVRRFMEDEDDLLLLPLVVDVRQGEAQPIVLLLEGVGDGRGAHGVLCCCCCCCCCYY